MEAKMPGVDKGCTTHSYACACREEHFTTLEAKLKIAVEALKIVVHGNGNNGPYSMMYRRRAAREALEKLK